MRDIRPQNLGDVEFDLSGSLKVKSNSAVDLPIYGFLLMVNSNMGPNSAHLRDIRLQIFCDFCELSRSLKVKYVCAIGHSIWFPIDG